MFTKFFSKVALVLTTVITACLAGCGGGGSSTGGPTPSISQACANGATDYPTCTPAVTPANLQTSVPAPTYAANSQELVAFNEINNFRKSAGLGLLAQNVKADTAAKNHADCIVVTQNFSHTETSSPCFTGTNPADRLAFAGYTGTVLGEELSGVNGSDGVRSLMNTLYHRAGLLNQNISEIGIGFNSSNPAPLVIELGYTKKQNNASNFVVGYPVNGQSDIPLSMFPELPNPFPDLSLSTATDYLTKTSSPISIHGEQNSTITLTSFSLVESVSNIPLDVRIVSKSNDVNNYVAANSMYFVGKSPFKISTKYTWVFVGSMNGVPVNLTSSFTTETSPNIGGGAKL